MDHPGDTSCIRYYRLFMYLVHLFLVYAMIAINVQFGFCFENHTYFLYFWSHYLLSFIVAAIQSFNTANVKFVTEIVLSPVLFCTIIVISPENNWHSFTFINLSTLCFFFLYYWPVILRKLQIDFLMKRNNNNWIESRHHITIKLDVQLIFSNKLFVVFF